MGEGDNGSSDQDRYTEAVNANRLNKRILAVTSRSPKPVSVTNTDGTILLRGRRKSDRFEAAADRRTTDRRKARAASDLK